MRMCRQGCHVWRGDWTFHSQDISFLHKFGTFHSVDVSCLGCFVPPMFRSHICACSALA